MAEAQIPHGYKQTEVGVIPEDWNVVPIGKAGQVLGGRQRSPHYVGELCKYLRVANVFDGFIDTDDVLEMPFSAAEKERFLLKYGDILLNEGQSIELVGRSAIYQGTPEDCCFQNTLVRFRAGPRVYPEFAQLVFQQYLRTGVFASIALQTTSIAHLGAGRLVALKMPLPTKAEQEAIAKALSDADALIESLEQLIAKKRQIKQGAMQELLTGKRRLPGFETKLDYKQTEVGVIPEDWDSPELGDILKSMQLGGNYKNSERETNWPLIKMGNLGRGSIKLDKLEFIDSMQGPSSRDRLEADDVFLNTRNTLDLVGKVAIWRNELPEAYFNSNIMRMKFDEQRVSSYRFMNYILNTSRSLRGLRGIAIGTTSVAAIS
jgi:type I restriction enzyme S subunit